MYSVIIVDDEAKIMQGLNKYVPWDELGYFVAGLYSNGEEALGHIKAKHTDVVITDIKMPLMNGLELVENASRLEDIPEFIIISAYDEFEYAQLAMKRGVKFFLVKPIDLEEIAEVLRQTGAFLKKKNENFINSQLPMELIYELNSLEWSAAKEIADCISQLKPEVISQQIKLFLSYFTCKGYEKNVIIEYTVRLISDISSILHSQGIDVTDYIQLTSYMTPLKSEEVSYQDIEDQITLFCRDINCVFENKQNNHDSILAKKMMQYIKENYRKDISLESLAKTFFLNSVYLSSYFKKHAEVNFIAYLMQCRVESAKDMLLYSNIDIETVCHNVGYNNSRHFINVFKKYAGMSPAQYRKTFKK